MTMRVVHVIPGYALRDGGTYAALRGLTHALLRRGVHSLIVCTAAIERVSQEDDDAVPVLVLPRSGWARWWTSHSCESARQLSLQMSHTDVIHVHSLWHHLMFVATQLSRQMRKPYIVTPHGGLEPGALQYKGYRKRLFAYFQRGILRRAAAVHAISDNEVNSIRHFGVNNRIVMIPNGLVVEDFQKWLPRTVYEQRYPQLVGKRLVLFLGRLHPIKGLDILIPSVAAIVRQYPDVMLCIAGPDDVGYRSTLEQLRQSLHLNAHVTFLGMVEGDMKLALLQRAEVVAVPSYSEVRGLTALEAMGCGVPVILTHQCSFPEVEEVEAGLIIHPNRDELAHALRTVLDDAALRHRMGAQGQHLVRTRFTWEKVAEQMYSLYESAC